MLLQEIFFFFYFKLLFSLFLSLSLFLSFSLSLSRDAKITRALTPDDEQRARRRDGTRYDVILFAIASADRQPIEADHR